MMFYELRIFKNERKKVKTIKDFNLIKLFVSIYKNTIFTS